MCAEVGFATRHLLGLARTSAYMLVCAEVRAGSSCAPTAKIKLKFVM